MADDCKMKIKDWIMINSNVSEVATKLCISYPVACKYIEYYDFGDHSKIPSKILEYFDKVIFEDNGSSIDKIKTNYQKKIKDSTNTIIKCNEEIERLQSENYVLCDELNDAISRGICDVSLNELKDEINRNIEDIDCHLFTVKQEKINLDYYSQNLSYYENASVGIISYKKIHKLKTSYYFQGDKCVIVHTGQPRQGRSFILDLYAKVGYEYAFLGSFDTIEDMNYFMIDEKLIGNDMYYEITQCDIDSKDEFIKKSVQSDCYQDSDATTGMCAIKRDYNDH